MRLRAYPLEWVMVLTVFVPFRVNCINAVTFSVEFIPPRNSDDLEVFNIKKKKICLFYNMQDNRQ